MDQSLPLFVYFCPFLITISITQIEKSEMVCLGLNPQPQDCRRRQNHGAIVAIH